MTRREFAAAVTGIFGASALSVVPAGAAFGKTVDKSKSYYFVTFPRPTWPPAVGTARERTERLGMVLRSYELSLFSLDGQVFFDVLGRDGSLGDQIGFYVKKEGEFSQDEIEAIKGLTS